MSSTLTSSRAPETEERRKTHTIWKTRYKRMRRSTSKITNTFWPSRVSWKSRHMRKLMRSLISYLRCSCNTSFSKIWSLWAKTTSEKFALTWKSHKGLLSKTLLSMAINMHANFTVWLKGSYSYRHLITPKLRTGIWNSKNLRSWRSGMQNSSMNVNRNA